MYKHFRSIVGFTITLRKLSGTNQITRKYCQIIHCVLFFLGDGDKLSSLPTVGPGPGPAIFVVTCSTPTRRQYRLQFKDEDVRMQDCEA